MPTRTQAVLKPDVLIAALDGVRYVLIGGMAAVAHGASYVTGDLDLCYAPDEGNRQRLADALRPFDPYPRDIEPGLPFVWDARTLRDTPLLTLTTSVGAIDFLPSVLGLGDYEEVEKASIEIDLFGHPVRLLTLDGLIASKRALGRPKDIALADQLDVLRRLS